MRYALAENALDVVLRNSQEAVGECEQMFVVKCPMHVLMMKWVQQDARKNTVACLISSICCALSA